MFYEGMTSLEKRVGWIGYNQSIIYYITVFNGLDQSEKANIDRFIARSKSTQIGYLNIF